MAFCDDRKSRFGVGHIAYRLVAPEVISFFREKKELNTAGYVIPAVYIQSQFAVLPVSS